MPPLPRLDRQTSTYGARASTNTFNNNNVDMLARDNDVQTSYCNCLTYLKNVW